MYLKQLFYSLIIMVLVSNLIFAQDSPTESQAEKEKAQQEKEKKAVALIEDIAGQVSFLKNPDNRALTFASVADLLWKRDEKRARQLFRQSADEIVASNNAPSDNTTQSPFAFLLPTSSPRADILRTIAARDAELALELLYITRPANVAAALASYSRNPPKSDSKTKSPADSMDQSRNRVLAENELRLEQSFSEKAAENDPKLAAKMLRESIAKNGVTNSVFGILQKINEKDNELAVKLLNEINQKLIGENFDSESNTSSLAVDFLRRFYIDADKNAPKSKETKTLKLEAAAAKELANKLADAFLKSETSRSMNIYFQMRSAMSILEKIIPERSALLKQKQSAMKKTLPEEMTRFDDVFDSDDKSPDKMVSNAAKMPAQMRGFMYRNAVNEAVKDGSTDAVRASLNQAPAGKERDEAIAYLDSKVAESKIKDGKIDEARKIIDSLGSTKEKVERLVQMAIGFQQKNTKEDSEIAVKLMTEARGLIDYSPEDEDAANDFLRIVSGYAYVEPATAFSMLDAFADQVNELVNASATVAKFDKNNPNFKNGELIMTRGLPRIGGKVLSYGKEAQLLANDDIDRLQNIAGKFQRPDAQILLKLYIVQAFFTGKIGLQGTQGGNRENFTIAFESN
ncbi:MAG: hypothetical protein ACR2F2_14135 [Pyrinomonadaceae bacterium]